MSETKEKLTKDQLKVIALTQRIGELTSNYEERIADLRADFTEQSEMFNRVMQQQHEEIEELKKKLEQFEGDNRDVEEGQAPRKPKSTK